MIASLLLTAASLGQLFGYWFAIPEHIWDKTWPLHARFHMIQAFFWVTGLNGGILALVWWPLQHREQWSFWTLLALLIFAQTSYFFALLALPKGHPGSRGNWYDWVLGLDLLIYVVGLVWAAATMGIF